MKIDKNDKVLEIPIMEIRNFLRRFRTPTSFSLQTIIEYFCLSEQHGYSLLSELIALEYVEERRKDEYEVTIKGNAFAQTKFVNRMNKAKADKIFSEFMKRVEVINSDCFYLYRVSKLVLFGSYLDPTRNDYGDIDIAYELERKIDNPQKFQAANQRIVGDAKKAGKIFYSFVDEICYSETVVLSHLKNRNPYISLHHIEEIEILSVAHKQVFP